MTAESDPLVAELAHKLVETLGLDLAPEAVDPAAPLIGAGLGIDSICAPPAHDLPNDPACARLVQRVPPAAIVACSGWLGHHASVGATATAIAARAVVEGVLPFPAPPPIRRRRLLLLEFGPRLTATEVFA